MDESQKHYDEGQEPNTESVEYIIPLIHLF